MREVNILFSNIDGDGMASYLVDVGGESVFDGAADRAALTRALAEFDSGKSRSMDSITSITIRAVPAKVLRTAATEAS